MKDWKSELGFEIVKHEPEEGMPIYLVREDGADDREATITERVLWDALVEKSARVPLTDAEIDTITRTVWGQQFGVLMNAHRLYARAVLHAAGITPQEGANG